MKAQDLKGKTIAFAGSGGLDSCTITRWLKDQGVRVVCFTADLGQPDEEDMEAIEERMRFRSARYARTGTAPSIQVPVRKSGGK